MAGTFKPMLAVAADLNKIQFPVFASPKLDGIRCAVIQGVPLSRTLKAIPNKHISSCLAAFRFEGFDGELIVGEPTSKTCYTDSVSNVMAFDKVPAFTYHVFDLHNSPLDFMWRFEDLQKATAKMTDVPFIKMLPQQLINDSVQLLEYEAEQIQAGYEGVIIRKPMSPYKFGRSTVNEGYLLKVKRFEDSEAVIIGFEEEMFNGNEAETNELGRTKRSTAKAGLSGKGTLGAFLVKDLHTNVEFSIGTGLTAAQRSEFWKNRKQMEGSLVKYKFFPVGVKDKPRHPVYLGPRDRSDI